MSSPIAPFQFIIGVDTHRDTHAAAILNRHGAHCAALQIPTTHAGFRQLLSFASTQAPGERLWAIEGTGSYGRTLTRFLLEQQEAVSEVERPQRPARRSGAKSDALDAVRAAREVLAREQLHTPRCSGPNEALRVLLVAREGAAEAYRRTRNQLKALILTSPEALRSTLRTLPSAAQLERCARLRLRNSTTLEQRATVLALRSCARRAHYLLHEVHTLEGELKPLVQQLAPQLLAEAGIATVHAARILCAWSQRQRWHSEAAFATLAGVAPLPASSGQTVRYRLSRRGDRRLNRALELIVRCRLAHHSPTKAYAARRLSEGKNKREIRRCLKRYLARRLFRLLQQPPHT